MRLLICSVSALILTFNFISCTQVDDELQALRNAGLASSVINKINNILSEDGSNSSTQSSPQDSLPRQSSLPEVVVENSEPSTRGTKPDTSPHDFNCFFTLDFDQVSNILNEQNEMEKQLKHFGNSLNDSPNQINKQELMEMYKTLSQYFSNASNSMWPMIKGSMEDGKQCCEHLRTTFNQYLSANMDPETYEKMSQAVKQNEQLEAKQFVEIIKITHQFKDMIEKYTNDMDEMNRNLELLRELKAKKQQQLPKKKSIDIVKDINKVVNKFKKEEVKKITKFLGKVKKTAEQKCPNPNAVKKEVVKNVKNIKNIKPLKKIFGKKK
ncbi:uncharacterized protein LOC116344707 [Contarinia nasturtii]|uniref:uncharacterized protein LOC116344707 n=1 Tax=Contarinia nasturtii TaxID=265458 RepID=UPI0012D46E18|nr:uncharacterized protein LOC116344707 [Contarinia nasturtii]